MKILYEKDNSTPIEKYVEKGLRGELSSPCDFSHIVRNKDKGQLNFNNKKFRYKKYSDGKYNVDEIEEDKESSKMKILKETVLSDIEGEILEPEIVNAQVDDTDTGIANLIHELIIDENEAIQGYNDAIATLKNCGDDELIKIFQDIANEEYNHIGMLEKALELVSPGACNRLNGEAEADSKISASEIINPDDPNTLVVFSESKYDDRITDRLTENFIKNLI